MRMFPESDLYKKTDLELEELHQDIRKDLAICEQVRRKDCAALANTRKVQAQRRPTFPKP